MAVQACQSRLESPAREIASAEGSVTKVRVEAKKSSEEAAELRGQLTAANGKPPTEKKSAAVSAKAE